MANLCELGDAPQGCADFQEYLSEFMDGVMALDNLRTGIGDELSVYAGGGPDDLWGACTPPDCSAVFWYQTSGANANHNLITSRQAGVWSGSISSAPVISPYYLLFEGDYRPLTEGWEEGWFIDGQGNGKPSLTLDTITNYLVNGDFEDWALVTNPDNWTIGVGTYAEENAIINSGLSSVEFTTDGAGAATLTQTGRTVPLLGWYKFTAFVQPTSIDPTAVMGLSTTTGFLGNSVQIGIVDEWSKVSCTDFANALTVDVQLDGSTFNPTTQAGYADTASLSRIIDGWNTKKEFYSAYGTFHLDFTLAGSDYAGLLLNYVPITSIYTNDASYFMVIANPTTITLLEQTDVNTVTTLGSWAYTYVPGATLEVIVASGAPSITINYNSLLVGTRNPTIDATGTRHGMLATTGASPIQAFSYKP
jgi:hypothetical protein